MKRTALVATMVLMFGTFMLGTSHADDTQIFGGATVNVPPNVLIIFDNSGSMAETVTVPGTGDEYDRTLVYTGSYNRRYVYYRNSTGGWSYFCDIGSNYTVDSTEISCTQARNDLNAYGNWIGRISSSGSRPCGTSYSERNLRMGNYLNYISGSGSYTAQKLVIAKKTIERLIRTTDGVRFGIMIFNSSEGGRILAPVATRETTADKDALVAQINALTASTWTPLAETLAEAGLYFARKQSWFNSGVDYATDYDPAIQYRCQKNYIIIMTDGESTQDRNSKLWDTIYMNGKVIGDYDADRTGITNGEFYYRTSSGSLVEYGSYGSDYLDDVAKFLYDEDILGDLNDSSGASFNSSDYPHQNIITYTIGFAINHQLLSETADSQHGQGDYFTTNDDISLQDIFESIIGRILQTNAQFISPVVPVNRLNRTYADNGLYIGIFSPESDANKLGLWKGNLKKFGFSKQGEVLDREGNPAASSSGAILQGAHSVWSDVQGPEGMTVDIGGAGSVLKAQTTRNFKINGSSGMEIFGTANTGITAADLGLSTAEERADLINFVTAQDIYSPSYSGEGGRNRDWVLGDIIHSQPAVYYDKNNNLNVLFVGTNHGFLHCFLDRDNGTTSDLRDDTVEESWAFMPRALLGNLKYLPPENYTATIPGNGEHEYFVDGSPIVYRSGSTPYVAFGLRRGGKNLNTGGALEKQYFILNISSYSSPTYAADVSVNVLGADAGDEKLGQSWCTPRFSKIKTGATTQMDVLLLTGGYDTNQDNDDPGSADSKGRAVFAVGATEGALVSSLNFNHGNFSKMRYSMVDLRSYDNDDDGCDDVIYAPSLGGDLFVFDDASSATGTPNDGVWTKRLLFTAQNRGSTSKLRKFFYAPGIAQETWGDWVYIGSGNRESPLEETGSSVGGYNRFYAIRYTFPSSWDNDTPLTDTNLTDVSADTLQGTVSTPSAMSEEEKYALRQSLSGTGNGWFFDLEHAGEKVVSTPLVYNKVVYFTTFTPSTAVASGTDPCGRAGVGTARIYAVDYRTGEAVFERFDGDSTKLTKEDRFMDIGSGIPSEPTLVVTEQGVFIIVGTEQGPIGIDTEDRRSIIRYYWKKQ